MISASIRVITRAGLENMRRLTLTTERARWRPSLDVAAAAAISGREASLSLALS